VRNGQLSTSNKHNVKNKTYPPSPTREMLRRGNGKPLNNIPSKSAFFTLVIYSQKEELTNCVGPQYILGKT
jgi:hypothetical protein